MPNDLKIAIIVVGKFNYNELVLKQIKRCYNIDDNNVDLYIYNNNSLDNNEQLNEIHKNMQNFISKQKLAAEKIVSTIFTDDNI